MIKQGGEWQDGRLADRARIRRARLDDSRRASTAPQRSARSRRRTRRSRSCTCCRSWCAASAATTSTSACARPISRGDGKRDGMPWLGMPIADVGTLERVLVDRQRSCARTIRCSRSACARRRRSGAQVHRAACGRRRLADADRAASRSSRRRAGRSARGDRRRGRRRKARSVPPTSRASKRGDAAQAIADSLLSGEQGGVLLGNAAQQHPQAAQLHRARAGDRAIDRRDARLPHRSGQQRRRLPRRRAAAAAAA